MLISAETVYVLLCHTHDATGKMLLILLCGILAVP